MDEVQVQQQHHQQQVVMQQQQEQQHHQQVSSSMQMKTVKQVQQFQTYEQQSSGGVQGSSVQYQLPPQQLQQSLQYQMSQQNNNSSSTTQHAPPASMEHHIPIQLASSMPPEHHVPIHGGVPTPFVNQNSMAPPQSANQNAFPSQFANHNVAPSQQFTNGNNAPQHGSYPNAGVPPQYADAQNVDAQHPSEPYYASGTTQDKPDGYTTAYNTIRGEWPPKQENEAPNLTTTYPSGFKLKDQAGFQTGPAKVVTSQPAFKITQPIRRKGDDKWPPRGSAEPTQEEEVREFVKPKKSNKNYEEFFAQNALPHNYAGYRPPPGTQHFGTTADGLSDM